jgi:multidrug efflux pump subunit AcrA (membrane-fusion protein)
MDIIIETEKKLNWRYIKLVCAVLAVVAIGFWLKGYFGQATALVDSKDIRLAEVQSGQFKINVRGIGVLKPKEVVWVAAQVAGRVEKVFVKAAFNYEKRERTEKFLRKLFTRK